MEEILIYYEEEVRSLRERVKKQNLDLTTMYQQLELRYRLYANLEEEYNNLKEEYERFKTECSIYHTKRSKKDAAGQLPPELRLED